MPLHLATISIKRFISLIFSIYFIKITKFQLSQIQIQLFVLFRYTT
jgi:hypothetical protein